MNSKTVSCKKIQDMARSGERGGGDSLPISPLQHLTTLGLSKFLGSKLKYLGGKGGIPDESMNGDL